MDLQGKACRKKYLHFPLCVEIFFRFSQLYFEFIFKYVMLQVTLIFPHCVLVVIEALHFLID